MSFATLVQKKLTEQVLNRDALQTVLDNAILLMLMPPWLLRLPAMPRSWARLGEAAAEFKQYMVHMLDEETSLMKRGEKGTGSSMTSLERALGTHHNEEAAAKTKDDQKTKGLRVDEIFGNILSSTSPVTTPLQIC